MDQGIEVIGWGMLPCLHCGEVIKLDGDIHLCKEDKNKWLDNQKVAILQLGNNLVDLKQSFCEPKEDRK